MRWSNEDSRYSGEDAILAADEIIYEAFSEGYLKWHIFQMALGKIRTRINGSWMFEQKQQTEKNVSKKKQS